VTGSTRSTAEPERPISFPAASTDRASPNDGPATPVAAEAPAASALAGLRSLGAALAWLSGSVAGIGAVFYACGYLVTLANLQMLGLDLMAFRYDPASYMQLGGNFAWVSAWYAVQGSYGPYVPLVLVLLIVSLGGRLSGERGRRLATTRPFRSYARHREAWKALAYLLLLVLLGFQLRQHLLFPPDLTVSGVLYPSPGGSAAGPIREWIVAGKEGLLQERYFILVEQQVVIGVLLVLAWNLYRASRWRTLLTVPFAAVFGISLLYLPLEYGKLALPNKFPQVVIRLDHPGQTAGQSTAGQSTAGQSTAGQSTAGQAAPGEPTAAMYLLNKTDSEFVLWDPRQRKIVWVPTRTVASAEISESRTLSEIIKASETARK
jgi:hypothetical protein